MNWATLRALGLANETMSSSEAIPLLEMSELPLTAEEQNSRAVLRAGRADPWGMFPPGAGHKRLNHPKLQASRTVPVQCQSQRGYFCNVLHCAEGCQGVWCGNGTPLASHCTWIQGKECRLPCSCDSQLSLSLCCEYTNRT